MRTRAATTLALCAIAGAAAVGSAATPAATPPDSRLRAFAGCAAFRAYVVRQAVPLVGAYGLGGTVAGMPVGVLPPGAARDAGAAQAATDAYSGTNVQEAGVDEPDLVKTNGVHLFVAARDRLRVLDVRNGRPRLVATLRLPSGGAGELLLAGDRLLVLSRAPGIPAPGGRTSIRAPWPLPVRSVVTEVDLRDPSRPRIVRTLELGGSHLAARLVGRSVRLVVSSPLGIDLPFEHPATSAPADAAASTARNVELVRGASARRWLPSYTIRTASGRTAATGSLVQCRDIRRPPQFSGLGIVTVLTIDLDRGLDPIDSDAVVSDGRVVYASRARLYVATERWDRRVERGSSSPVSTRTQIHVFDVTSPSRTTYRASGSVPGTLLSQWSLSERGGILRVASTTRPLWWGGPQSESETVVTTLAEHGAGLVQLGRVGGLGRGERVYAVRFTGDVGYVVTFREVDPLYTIDLSSPARPVVRGELKIRGYSAYLHPVAEGRLLGIGQDATDEGRVVGVQASLFDVSDLRQPRRLDAVSLGRSWSLAEHDHHAFLWWPRSRLAVIPVSTADALPFSGALGLRVTGGRLSVAGRVAHPSEPLAAPVLRALVVGQRLYTVSELGVQASSLATFRDLGFARFPA